MIREEFPVPSCAGDGRLERRVAVVTGGGQGLGRAIAVALADEGCSVALLGRTGWKVEEVRDEIRQRGCAALAFECDVADRAAVDDTIAQVLGAWSAIDIVVNNAQGGAIGTSTPTADLRDEDVLEFFRTGPLGSLHVMQAALPALKASSHAAIVNFGSGIGVRGQARQAGYAMAKEAIGALTKTAALEWGKYGIRVNAVCPNGETPAAEVYRLEDPVRWEKVKKAIPLGRMGEAYGDIGRAVVALVSEDLRFLTGATVMLDGGQVMLR